MKSSISHLPKINQEQLLRIVDIIKEVVLPEKVILFGSYAKGKQTEHKYQVKDGTIIEYISDYDILIVLKDIPVKLYDLESEIISKTEKFNAPVNLEIHEIDYINKGLEVGEYFFTDIVKEGIMLYNTGNVEFANLKELSSLERKEKAERYFRTWFPQAIGFIEGSNFHFEKNNLRIAVFELHQAVESLYYTILLVFTDYKPKLHNLWKLRKKTKPYSEELFIIFQVEFNDYDKHLFDLLKRGYIDARYRDDYMITKTELQHLMEKINLMIPLVEKICNAKIDSI